MKCSKGFCDISPVLAALEVLADFGKFAEIEQLNAHPARRCRRVIIFAEVVLDESDFPVGSKLFFYMSLNVGIDIKSLSCFSVGAWRQKYRGLILPVRTVFQTELVYQFGTESDFYPLYGIEYKESEFPVEAVEAVNVVPCSAWGEVV